MVYYPQRVECVNRGKRCFFEVSPIVVKTMCGADVEDSSSGPITMEKAGIFLGGNTGRNQEEKNR